MFTYEIWDKKSKINGVAAKTILADSRYKNADAMLLIKNDGAVVQIQALKSDVEGVAPLTLDEAISLGERIIAARNAVQETEDTAC